MSTERAPINVLLSSEHSGEQIAVMDNIVGAGFPGPHCITTPSTRPSTCSKASSPFSSRMNYLRGSRGN
jgi:hypothetical protein